MRSRAFAGAGPSMAVMSGRSALTTAITSSSLAAPTLLLAPVASTQRRTIIVPKQMKAYGGMLNFTKGGGKGTLQPQQHLMSAKQLGLRTTTKCVESFRDMLLPKPLTDAMAAMGVDVPSPVQQRTIPVAMERHHCLIAAPPGTGKTLAYLAPIFANMIEDRDAHKVPLRERRPRCIIACPTLELVSQVSDVCRQLGDKLGFHVVDFVQQKQAKRARGRAMKRQMPDVVVASPHVVEKMIRAKRLFVDDLRYLVLDEADTLLSEEHEGYGRKLSLMTQRRSLYGHLWPVDTQRIFATAAMSQTVVTHLNQHIPGARNIVMPDLHELNTQLRHRFYRVGTAGDKLVHLRYLLERGGNRATPWPSDDPEVCSRQHDWAPLPVLASRGVVVEGRGWGASGAGDTAATTTDLMVVHPKVSTLAAAPHHNPAGLAESTATAPARCVWQHLTATSAPFTGHIKRLVVEPGERVIVYFDKIDRATAIYHRLHDLGFKATLVHGTLPTDVRNRNFARWATGQCNILLATDLISRGLDYRVDRVINFDCPKTPMNYMLRAGRTGRMGRVGYVTSLFTQKRTFLVNALRTFIKGAIPMNDLGTSALHGVLPTHRQYSIQKKNAIARRYVKLITTRLIPAHKERTFLRTQATWRPLVRHHDIAKNAGIAERRHQRVMDAVQQKAIWRRRGLEARIKGGTAKFGRSAGRRPTYISRSVKTGGDMDNAGVDFLPRSPL
jgi:superfamily II DNA/RNA helicase